jgi:hypothetical protein
VAFLKLLFSGERLLVESGSQPRASASAVAVVSRCSRCLHQSYREFESLSLAKTPGTDGLSVQRSARRSPGIRPFLAGGCSPRPVGEEPKAVSDGGFSNTRPRRCGWRASRATPSF